MYMMAFYKEVNLRNSCRGESSKIFLRVKLLRLKGKLIYTFKVRIVSLVFTKLLWMNKKKGFLQGSLRKLKKCSGWNTGIDI